MKLSGYTERASMKLCVGFITLFFKYTLLLSMVVTKHI